MSISVWPLDSDMNVNPPEAFWALLNKLFTSEGGMSSADFQVTPDASAPGVGIAIAAGSGIVDYNAPAGGGKRLFTSLAVEKSLSYEFLNPGFEAATTNWSPFGTGAVLTRDTTQFHSGVACGLLTIVSGGSSFTKGVRVVNTLLRYPPEQNLGVSVWFKAPQDQGISLEVRQMDSFPSLIESHTVYSHGTGDWTKIQNPISGQTTLPDCAWIDIVVATELSGASGNFRVDDFEITKPAGWPLTFQQPHPTLPRVDRVVALIADPTVPGAPETVSGGFIGILPGVPTSGATLVNLSGASIIPNNSLLLANVLVPALAGSLSSGNIDNAVRPVCAVA